MPAVNLEDQEWRWLLTTLANKCTWAEVNPLLMKIGMQLERQSNAAQEGIKPGNGQFEHPRDDSFGPPPQAGDSRRAEHKPQVPPRKT